jgi:hypothetical protein
MQQVGIIAEQAEAVVASLAQQSADGASVVIMIKVLRCRITADSALVALRQAHLGDVDLGQLVPTVEICGAVLGVFACLAATAEA